MSSGNKDAQTGRLDDILVIALRNVTSRNNYYRAGALAVLTWIPGCFLGEVVRSVLIGLAVVSLFRGLARDHASKRCFLQAPTALELLTISQASEWASKRHRMLRFPLPLSERDFSVVIPSSPLMVHDPMKAMAQMHALFEDRALRVFSDPARDLPSRTRCFRLKKHDVNYPDGTELCPLPARGLDSLRRSHLSLCFCQRRTERFIPYLVFSYIHLYTDDGRRVKSTIHTHGFSFSTWLRQDDPRLTRSDLSHEVLLTWDEAVQEYLLVNAGQGQGPSVGGGFRRAAGGDGSDGGDRG